MHAQYSNDLYSELLRNPSEELINKLIKLLLKGDITSYLNLYNYIFAGLPVVPYKYKSSIFKTIMDKIVLVTPTYSNSYAAAFSSKVFLRVKKTAAERDNAKKNFLRISERGDPIGYVELGILKLLSHDKTDSEHAIYYFEKALSLDKDFVYAHLCLGDYYSMISLDKIKSLQHYKIAAKLQLPGADAVLARKYLYQGQLHKASEYLSKPTDNYIPTKHLTFGLYLEMNATTNKNYINAFKHYLIAYALNIEEANYFLQDHLNRFLNTENEQLSKCFNSIFEIFNEAIHLYGAGVLTKPISADEIFDKLAAEFHLLQSFDIGNLVIKPRIIVSLNSLRQRKKRMEELAETSKKLTQIQNVLLNNIVAVREYARASIRETAEKNVLEKNETKQTESDK